MTAGTRSAGHVSEASGLTGSVARRFDPARGLLLLGGFGGFGIAVSGLYALTGVGFACPFRALTGWDCPLCGGTRLGDALLHGRIGAAVGDNPAVFVLLAVLTVLGGLWIIEALGGPGIRPPRRWADRLLRVRPTTWTVIGVLVAVVYTVVRNLL